MTIPVVTRDVRAGSQGEATPFMDWRAVSLEIWDLTVSKLGERRPHLA